MEKIIKSKYVEVKTVIGKTIPEFIWEKIAKYPHWKNADFLVCSATGKGYTYDEVKNLSKSFASNLKKIVGLSQGDIVGILLPNCPEYTIVLLGLLDAGCIPTLMNPAYTNFELKHLISTVDINCLVTIEILLPNVLSLQEEFPLLKSFIVLDGEKSEKAFSYNDLIQGGFDNDDFLKGSQIDSTKQTAIIPFSSGTTGLPKGVMLTHTTILTNILQVKVGGSSLFRTFKKNGEQEAVIGILPFFHVYGLSLILLQTMINGGKIICVPKFDPKTFPICLREMKPTLCMLVPPLLNFIVNCPAVLPSDLKYTHSVLIGAAPAGVSLIQKFNEKFGTNINYFEGYGLTELSPVTHIMDPFLPFLPDAGDRKIGSIGLLLPSTLAKVVDEEGVQLGPHQPGELCLKGPQVMKGYYKNEKATTDMIDPDGWVHTGDVVKYDEDGYFFIVDRLKEIIKTKGFQVSPSELENIMRSNSKVLDVAVIGVTVNGEELPRAYVVRKDISLNEKELHHFLNCQVSKFKQLAGGIEFIEQIPRSAAGKILRKELKNLYLEKIAINQ